MTDHSTSSAERITVTYAASQALLSAPLTPHFINLLKEQLPLRNLHWRPSQSTLDAVAARAAQQGKSAYVSSSVVPGSTIRTIQTLDIALKPLTDEIRRWRGDPGYFEKPGVGGLLDRPFVHLYFVVCEDSEHYRTTVRNEIRSWLSSLSFFHSKQAAPSSSAVGTPTQASSSRTSIGFGPIHSALPPVRSETPSTNSTTGISSGPNTPTNQGGPIKATFNIPSGPTEPEYLIVLITPPEGSGITGFANSATGAEAKTGMGRFINKSKGNMLEKARADFNTSKKDRVIQISRLPPVPAQSLGRSGLHSMDPTIWAELLTKMREAASSTFTTTIEAQEEEITRCGVTRGQHGWDFCSYFLAKDSLARTLEAVGLKDDAIGQYEDLEIVFAQAMQNGAVSFAPVGGDDTNDDSLPLLDVTKKPYADLIRRREISLFDFRCYLFARKSALLGKVGRVAAVMREAPRFISAVARMLRNNRLSSQWIESWTFSAALDVVEQCQAWLIQRGGQGGSAEDQLSSAFHGNKSELLDVARRQLDRIGIEAGHLPAREPFAFPSPDPASPAEHRSKKERDLPPLPGGGAEGLGAAITLDKKRKSSRPELQRAIESREDFDLYYLALCERVLAGWRASSRNRDALHIRTVVATLNYLRGKHQLAYDSLVQLTEAYSSAKFATLERHSLSMQLECHAKLNKPRDRAWVVAALAALQVSAQHPMSENLEPSCANWANPVYLCEQLRAASAALEREVPVSAFPLFSIDITDSSTRLAGTEDGSLLRVYVTSLLPSTQEVEDVRVCLATAGGGTLWYTSSKTELRAGITEVELFCPHLAHGVYTIDVSQIRIARLIFQYDHGAGSAGREAKIVRVPKDEEAAHVSVRLPQRIDLDQPRAIEVIIFSGRNNMHTAEFSITAPVDGSNLVECSKASISTSSESSSAALETSQSPTSVALRGLKQGTAIAILIPFLSLPESGNFEANITLTYVTTSSSHRHPAGKKRVLKIPVSLRTALPLGVNVQDFFRTSSLLSKFTISAGGGGSIRVQPVSLVADGEEDGGYEVTFCGSEREAMVTPRQPATYLFRIAKSKSLANADVGRTRLRLAVRYTALQEDAVATAVSALSRVVKEKGLDELEKGSVGRRLLQEALERYVKERLDLPAYSITGVLKTGQRVDRGWWRTQRRSWDPSQMVLSLNSLIDVIQSTLDAASLSSKTEEENETAWQQLTIPVEIPSMDYVNSVTLSLAPTTGANSAELTAEPVSLVVGQPIQLTVDIQTCTQWSMNDLDEAEEMVYDVVPDFECWLVDGAKRGTFAIGTTSLSTSPSPALVQGVLPRFSVSMTMVPLQMGLLPLPNVMVRPLSTIVEAGAGKVGRRVVSCETYTTNAGERVQVVPAKTTKAFYIPTKMAQKRISQGRTDSWRNSGEKVAGTGAGLDRMRTAWQSQQYGQGGQAWQAHV
ncbi:related to TRS130 - subunit of the TRAPP complex of the cis-Golgi [Melanopsichium pennsylvanicum]|uniref:Related to TRS130 - subunit of the TRAPP complex of the cis-Golgi n=2 Tax=Melanopsichium pennsylvanicum TaxID=63383 RepID=A0AAJ4XK96_9BASI|nr:conserved hypothetical protein [Melanopsichium pennsylvanicum 4]SNX83710.1 related to TRS130 - subunit of the TRAPP complex of the cis-Golgi [Melanopsichium pennsylvanicum]